MSQVATLPAQEPVTVDEAKERARERGVQVKEQASDRLRHEVDTRARQTGEQVQMFSQTLRRTASELRAQGQQGQSEMFDQVAMRAEQLGQYLTESDPDQMLSDARGYGDRVVTFFRRQPLLLAAAGVGAGLAASRLAGAARSQQQGA